jgi:hypothetical protein
MSQHVRMDWKRHFGTSPDPAEERVEGLWRHRRATPAAELA